MITNTHSCWNLFLAGWDYFTCMKVGCPPPPHDIPVPCMPCSHETICIWYTISSLKRKVSLDRMYCAVDFLSQTFHWWPEINNELKAFRKSTENAVNVQKIGMVQMLICFQACMLRFPDHQNKLAPITSTDHKSPGSGMLLTLNNGCPACFCDIVSSFLCLYIIEQWILNTQDKRQSTSLFQESWFKIC